ncbi:MAG: polyphosphate kinase 2 [Rhodobacteraceae bacterium]|nr:polyphosphate kinase 2 [Paracoccaceae bacterium]
MTRNDLPFGGAITRYLETEAPEEVRSALDGARKSEMVVNSYPYDTRLDADIYDARLKALTLELVRMQGWVQAQGKRLAIVFEGRDAAGKGGAISRFAMHLNPRVTRIAALPKPTERERGQWYFQRYISHLPSAGEIVLFDRSWYNRGVIEHVFGFCTHEERERFFAQVNDFEEMLVGEGIHLVKFWLNIGRAEQLRRFLRRERDPLRQWKLSAIDVEGLGKWDAYSAAIAETFQRSHTEAAPWTIVRADDKRRARLEVLRHVLAGLDYVPSDKTALGKRDPSICGGPELWHA